jgi:hypothetical protein
MGLWRPAASPRNAQNVLAVLFLGLITWKIGTGKSWAWWLNAIVYAGCVAGMLVLAVLSPEVMSSVLHASPSYEIASGIIQYTVQGLAFALLLSADSRKWFCDRRAHGKAMD